MSLVTGVHVNWLLDGDTSKPPTTQDQGRPYSRSEFERWLLRKTERLRVSKVQRAIDTIQFFAQLRAILQSANKRGDYIMARYKVRIAIKALRDQFAQDFSLLDLDPAIGRDRSAAVTYLWIPPLKAVKVVLGAIADARPILAVAKRGRQSARRRRSK